MTIEEAKGRLESFIDTFNICKEHDNSLIDISIGKEDIQAFTMAIEALQQESDAEFMCKVMSKTINKSTDDRNFIGGF